MQQVLFGILVLLWLLNVVIGLVYALTTKVVSYHAQVLGADNEALPDRVSAFYFATTNNVGFIILGYSVLSGYLIFGPIRHGDTTAMVFWLISYSIVALSGCAAARKLHFATGANTPWRLIGILGLVGLTAGLAWFIV